MDWDVFFKYALLPVLVTLLTGAGGFYLARAERQFAKVHDHASWITGMNMKQEQFEKFMADTKDHGERLKGVEVKVENIESVTGEMRMDLKELLKYAKKGNGGA